MSHKTCDYFNVKLNWDNVSNLIFVFFVFSVEKRAIMLTSVQRVTSLFLVIHKIEKMSVILGLSIIVVNSKIFVFIFILKLEQSFLVNDLTSFSLHILKSAYYTMYLTCIDMICILQSSILQINHLFSLF